MLECKPVALADIGTEAKKRTEQMRALKIIEQLVDAEDWRGVTAKEILIRFSFQFRNFSGLWNSSRSMSEGVS